MAERKKESFVTGAAVLTASTVVVKILGAVFKIPLSNIIGKAAMGDFGVAYNIYALLLTLSTAGLPVALSRMVSVGIQTISIDHEKGIFTDEFPPREDDGLTFSEAVNQELQLLLSLSPR